MNNKQFSQKIRRIRTYIKNTPDLTVNDLLHYIHSKELDAEVLEVEINDCGIDWVDFTISNFESDYVFNFGVGVATMLSQSSLDWQEDVENWSREEIEEFEEEHENDAYNAPIIEVMIEKYSDEDLSKNKNWVIRL